MNDIDKKRKFSIKRLHILIKKFVIILPFIILLIGVGNAFYSGWKEESYYNTKGYLACVNTYDRRVRMYGSDSMGEFDKKLFDCPQYNANGKIIFVTHAHFWDQVFVEFQYGFINYIYFAIAIPIIYFVMKFIGKRLYLYLFPSKQI
ncbi:MAG TPA: hypothetical protein VFA93_02915 [Patescibacteria group bacterium]|nr:hypothetical protein [Patescibacteria group bacterium]